MHWSVAIVGTAIHAPLDRLARSLEESIYHAGQAALADAGLAIEDIDGIVVAANDQLDGRAISVMMASGPVGGVGREILSTPSAAEHAFVLAALRIATGQMRTQLVVSWSPLEVESIAEALKLGTDPYFHRALPLDELSSHALQAASLEHAVPQARGLALEVASMDRRHGASAYPHRSRAPADRDALLRASVTRWPLNEALVAPPAFGLIAMVLASSTFADDRPRTRAAWVRGIGWATEAGFLGDRDLATAPALVAAAGQAYTTAGIDDPARAFALAEVASATPHQQLLAYEGLGLCARDDWASAVADGRFTRDGVQPVNLSGGAQSFYPVFCAGLVSIAEAANQVRGTAGLHQAARCGRALAHAASGFAMQYQTVVVLDAAPGSAS